MIRMGVWGMVMAVGMPLMGVPFMGMVLVERNRDAVRLAGASAFPFTQGAALHQPFHVVMVALLSPPNVLLEPEDLGSVFAEGAVHVRIPSQNVIHTLAKRVQHQWMIPEIAG